MVARDFTEAIEAIQRGRCPNDGDALAPYPQRSGYGLCSTCGLGWSQHHSPTGRAIGQFADGRHFTWLPTGTGHSRGDRRRDFADTMMQSETPSARLVPFLLRR